MPIPPTLPAQPRKLPVQARSIQAFDAILEAGARILERSGFGSFNTNAISALAGVSPGSLYRYFPDKDSVLRALVVRHVSETSKLAIDVIEAHTGPGALSAAIEAAVAHVQSRPALTTQLAFAEPLVLMEPHDDELAPRTHLALVQAIRNDHDLGSVQADGLAYDVLGIMKGMLLSTATRNRMDDPDLSLRIRLATSAYIQATLSATNEP